MCKPVESVGSIDPDPCVDGNIIAPGLDYLTGMMYANTHTPYQDPFLHIFIYYIHIP
jgi:hypothetical protein